MPRIYTEIRISHKNEGEKGAYERYLDESLKALGYKSRAEWLKEMARDTNNEATTKMSRIREGK
jgi:hypothetical protein